MTDAERKVALVAIIEALWMARQPKTVKSSVWTRFAHGDA